MRKRFFLTLLLLFGSVALCSADEIIHEIAVEGLNAGNAASLRKLLGLHVGERLDPAALRVGLQAASASGQIRWIRVEKESTGEGLRIRIQVDVRPRLAAISIQAPSAAWRLKIRRWLNLHVGDPVESSRIEQAARKIQARVVAAGYPSARFSPFLEYSKADNSVSLQAELRLGKPEIVAELEIEGLPAELDESEILPHFKTGKRYRRKTETAMETKVERRLRSLGWWDAVISDVERKEEAGGYHLVFRVDPGLHYTPVFHVPENFRKEAEEAFPDPAEEDLNVSQLGNLVEVLEERLRERGRPLVRVEASITEISESERRLELRITPGPELRLKEILFPGAAFIPEKELLKISRLKKGDGSRRHPLSRKNLDAAREHLRRAYLRRGFPDVIIHDAELEVLEEGGKAGLSLRIQIEEGIRLTVSSFDIQGLPSEALWALDRPEYRFDLMQAWDPDRLDTVVRLWEEALADSGYPESTINVEIRSPGPTGVDITLHVNPGPFVLFGKVVIAGLSRTRESVVRRCLRHAGLTEGSPYLDSVLRRAQLDLYRLGLFRSVTVGPIPGQEMMQQRGIVVEVDEGQQRSYLLGLGWGSDEGARITLGWSHLNLFGGGHALTLETRYSSREFRYQLSLRETLLPLLETPGYLAFYRTEEHFTDYDQRRQGVWMEVGDRLRRPYRHWVRYEYQVVNPDAPEEILSELERDQQQIHLSSLTPIFEWDHRDDPLNPRKGYLLSAALEWAFPAFGSEGDFLKLRTGYSWYHPLPKGKISAGLRAGAIFPFNLEAGTPENLQVPLAVRFFAGGPTTHRAFPRDRLGIPGETLDEEGRSIGGNASVLINLEYQHLLWKSIAGVVFVDGGNVWIRPEDISPGDFRWGLGLGLHLDTPAGPFRLEYAQKLDRLEGESRGEFFFSFGVAF